ERRGMVSVRMKASVCLPRRQAGVRRRSIRTVSESVNTRCIDLCVSLPSPDRENAMLQQLWSDIRGLFVRAPSPSHFAPRLPRADPPAMHVDLQAPPDYVGSLISGFLCVIAYRDAKGQQSVRRITCQQIISAGGHAYLNAFCHERRARRQFRVDRIAQLIDIHTGEVTDDPGRFLASFAIDRKTASGLSWGLSVRQKADLVAGLNAMVFMGRCDKEWHPLERSALERFVASFWIQSELRGDAPLGDILDHAERLTP